MVFSGSARQRVLLFQSLHAHFVLSTEREAETLPRAESPREHSDGFFQETLERNRQPDGRSSEQTAKKVVDRLLVMGILRKKLNEGQFHVYIDPRRLREVWAIINMEWKDEGVFG